MVDIGLRLTIFACLWHGYDAWGPTFEPLKGGLCSRTVLSTGADEYDEKTADHGYKLRYESRFEETDGILYNRRLFISEPFILDSSMFGIVNPYDEQFDEAISQSCTGDDCDDDCPIPEEYKKIAEHESVDVMSFLGLHRTQPIDSSIEEAWG